MDASRVTRWTSNASRVTSRRRARCRASIASRARVDEVDVRRREAMMTMTVGALVGGWTRGPLVACARESGQGSVRTLREQYALALESSEGAASRRTTIGMSYGGGTYSAAWRLGGRTLRGVVDTGSPFLTTPRACTEEWAPTGCVDASDVSFEAFEATRERYGMQIDDSTRWFAGRRASVGDWTFDELVFGVTDDVRGANAAPFVGLVKYVNRERGIRPSFLQQTDIQSFALDFDASRLTLSRDSLVDPSDSGVLRTVDLREKGAPVYHYASLCDELWINGERFRTSKPIFVVFDSGTTGMLVDRELFDASDFHLGTYQTHMKFTDTNGQVKYCGSSLKTCTKDCLFIVSPIDVPWPGCGKDYHVIFAGLSVLRKEGALTIDTERGLVRLGRFSSSLEV